jgi:hypothetical protein
MPKKQKLSIWIGFDSREIQACHVAAYSIRRRLSKQIPVNFLSLGNLRERGLYARPTEVRDGKLYDLQSRTDSYDGLMATEFAISRFLVPHLAGSGLALFVDCDVLFRCDAREIFDLCQPEHAVTCVQHGKYEPRQGFKMDGVQQSTYAFKNWSSVMVFNCDHRANRENLTLEAINTWPGRELHAFKWLFGGLGLVGSLPKTYNHLVGEVPHDPDARVIHYTNGGPWFEACRDVPHAEAWLEEQDRFVRGLSEIVDAVRAPA